MPDIININDSESVVKQKILDILEYDGISIEGITSWGVATVRLNQAASRLGIPLLENGQAGSISRDIINQLAVSPAPSMPNNLTLPVISGEVKYNETLTTNNGTWGGYPVPTFTYQWKADDVNISGAINDNYILGVSDIGKEIIVSVTATNLSGNSTADSMSVGPVISEPINLIAPLITGTLSYNETLTTSNGTWAAYPLPIEYEYQWKADNVDISGAINISYTTTVSDIGKTLTVSVKAENSEGENSQISNSVGPINSLPVNTNLPVISGYARTGETLTTSNGTWAAYPLPIEYEYQWKADNVDISGAINDSFELTDDQAGKIITVEIKAENSIGSSTAISAGTSASEPSWLPEGAIFYGELTLPTERYWRSSKPTTVRSSNGKALNIADAWENFMPNTTRMTDRGLFVPEPASTNRVTLVNNARPVDTTGVAITGGNGGHTFNLINDVSALNMAGLGNIAGPNVYHVINPPGNGTVQLQFNTDNGYSTGQFVGSVYIRGSGSARVRNQNQVPSYSTLSSSYARWSYQNAATTSSLSAVRVQFEENGELFVIIPQFEAGSVPTSPIVTNGMTTRAADAVTLLAPAGTYDLHLQFNDNSTQIISGWTPENVLPLNLPQGKSIKQYWGITA